MSTGSNLNDSADCTVTTNTVSASRITYARRNTQTAMGAWATNSFSHWRSSKILTGTESRKATEQRKSFAFAMPSEKEKRRSLTGARRAG